METECATLLGVLIALPWLGMAALPLLVEWAAENSPHEDQHT